MTAPEVPTRRTAARRAAGFALLLLAVVAVLWWRYPTGSPTPSSAPSPTYVGRAACAGCHDAEIARWTGSQHDLAMDLPTATTVHGDFADTAFEHFGTSTTFRRDGARYVVRTDGPDGVLHDYPVAYTFGTAPLQQYLLDIGQGRLQALGVAWDCRTAAEGGQRWFHLYPDEKLPAGDELHWTGLLQNWNYMCAECHSTNLRRHYDSTNDRFATTWSELDVSCESCHGPASAHVAWANAGRPADVPQKGLVTAFDERRGIAFATDPTTGLPRRSQPRTTQKELDTCARCHSRRTTIDEEFVPGRPLLDTHLPALLTTGLYHADGQMQDEVYNYQSFLQSRMAQHGVTCSDCHDPHSGKTRAPGDALCLTCHDAGLATPAHTHHPVDSQGARCVACHAPTVTYMGVDPRHDHSFRIPRPDLAERYGVPDACTGCHRDHAPAWASTQLVQWFGRVRADRSSWTPAFAAARAHRADAPQQLLPVLRDATLPAIVRATALHELAPPWSPEAVAAVRTATTDADPLVRWTAAEALADGDPALQAPLRGLLRDPVRAVRMAAARGFAGQPLADWPAADAAALRVALAELVAAQQTNADRPEAHLELGNLAAAAGDFARAEAEFRTALRLYPRYAAGRVNLADLLRRRGDEAGCERILRDGLADTPDDAALLHALGLCLVRQGQAVAAIDLLARAAAAAPDDERYAYVHAVALAENDRRADAIAALRAATTRRPDARELRELLVDYLQANGDLDEARRRAAEFTAQWPDDPTAEHYRRELLR